MPGGIASGLGSRNGMFINDPYGHETRKTASSGPNFPRQDSQSTTAASRTSTSSSRSSTSLSASSTVITSPGTNAPQSTDISSLPTTGTRNITDALFPSVTSGGPLASTSSSTHGGNRATAQKVLMWMFAVIAVCVIGIIVIWRWCCFRIRRRERRARALHSGRANHNGAFTLGNGFASQSDSAFLRDSDFQNSWDRNTRPIQLSPTFLHTGIMPLVDAEGNLITARRERRDRRVRGVDVDEGGRRAGRLVDEDGVDIADAEELPAYDGDKGPPGYHTITMAQVGELLSGRGRAHSQLSRTSGEVVPLSGIGDNRSREGVSTMPVTDGTTTTTTTTRQPPSQPQNDNTTSHPSGSGSNSSSPPVSSPPALF